MFKEFSSAQLKATGGIEATKYSCCTAK